MTSTVADDIVISVFILKWEVVLLEYCGNEVTEAMAKVTCGDER